MRTACTALQVNLVAGDLAHARHLLPHQIATWQDQVEKVVLTVDVRPGTGRYAVPPGAQDAFARLLDDVRDAAPLPVEVHEVDDGPEARAEVSTRYLGGVPGPIRDSHGAPFHGYLAGLASTEARYVLHVDSDMLFGGGSATWLAEAVAELERDDHLLLAGPLGGPPTSDGRPRVDVLAAAAVAQPFSAAPSPTSTGIRLRFTHATTRCFLVDTERLEHHVIPLHPTAPSRLSTRSPGVAPLEVCLSRLMHEQGLQRLDLLGAAPGMWSLHPPFRGAAFLEGLPALLAVVERGDVPEAQRGDHDLNDSMVDWSRPRRARRRWER
ncbi:hypothetical protein B7486_53455, partial [cyanobacterium TDX16]